MNEIKNFETNKTLNIEEKSKNFIPDKRVDIKIKQSECNENSDSNSKENTFFNPDRRIESESNEITEQDINDYIKDLKKYSDYPETIPEKPFSPKDIERCSSEETGNKRKNFQSRDHNNPESKENLRKEWEKLNGVPWPRYTKFSCPSNRKIGDCYDAHHIQPLGWGGKNEANNITPLHCDVHYDSKGVHNRENSPYAKIDKKLGENKND